MAERKPTMGEEKPTMAGEKPTMAGEKPTMAHKEPTMESRNPSATVQAPSPGSGPAREADEPPAMVELRDALPADLRRTLEELGRRAEPAEIRRCIERLCAWRSLTAEQLARLLDRNMGYLKHKYLRPMKAEGLIRYTIPDMPKHPRQAYRSVMGQKGQPSIDGI
jgi:hypothetical protein